LLKARVARFYGWTDDYMNSMDASTFEEYVLAMESLEARESMSMISNISYPEMKKSSQQKLARDLRIQSKKNIDMPRRELTEKDLQAMARRLNG